MEHCILQRHKQQKQPEEKSHPRTENTIDNSATASVIAVRKSRFSETKLEFYQWILMNILRWRYGDVCVLYYNSFFIFVGRFSFSHGWESHG